MPRKIILDTDPGVDDVLAILLALASPEIDVALISIVFGNTHAPVAHANLLKIYHMLALEMAAVPEAAARYARLAGQVKTVLALGDDGPIGGEKAVAAYFHGPDGLSNISLTHPNFTPPERIAGAVHDHLEIASKPSYQVILDILGTEPEHTVTIVALGPLTNLAHALREDPKTFSKVDSVVWMGGALEHPGNTSPTAEFNCFADPYAATEILDACKRGAFNVIMAPLDVTTPHTIPFADLIDPSFIPNNDGSLPQSMPTPGPLRSFVSSFLLRVRGLQASFGLPDAMEMHDPLAVWYTIANAGQCLTKPSPGWTLVPREFQVERTGEFTRGMCVVDRRGTGDQGEMRTKEERLKGNHVPNNTNPTSGPSLPPKDETRGRMGEEVVKPNGLPQVIVGTPGKDELRQKLLSRVFGTEV